MACKLHGMISRRDKNWEGRALTESLQPPESSIDIDIAAVAVAAMAEALVGIDMLIATDGVGTCTVISIFVARLSFEEPKFSWTG